MVDRARNFYGVVAVKSSTPTIHSSGNIVLSHGQITHGLQFTDPEKSRWATTYYAEDSGVGRAMLYFRKRRPDARGAVGLGAGTLATYAQAGRRVPLL